MTGRDGSAEVVELGSVPGFVVFDLPGAPLSAGGTRLAPDVSVAEVSVLARSMTYKFAALGERVGGAKAGVRGDPADRAGRAALMARFCAAVRPLTDAGRFLTGPDMGTAEEDFAPLRERRAAPAVIRAVVAGVPFEDLLTGYGVAVAAETALGGESKGPKGPKGLDGRSVAIEGFGKVGGGVAREVGRRGGRVAAVSTVAGCVADPSGLDVDRLLTLRQAHGDGCVLHYGRPVMSPHQLFTEVNADVLVPGTRPGAIDAQTARSLPPAVRVIAPAANAPYTEEGAEVAAGARDRGTARFRVQRGRGDRLPVPGRRDPGPGPVGRRGQGRRPHPGGARPSRRPARRGLRTGRRVLAELVGRAARAAVRARPVKDAQ